MSGNIGRFLKNLKTIARADEVLMSFMGNVARVIKIAEAGGPEGMKYLDDFFAAMTPEEKILYDYLQGLIVGGDRTKIVAEAVEQIMKKQGDEWSALAKAGGWVLDGSIGRIGALDDIGLASADDILEYLSSPTNTDLYAAGFWRMFPDGYADDLVKRSKNVFKRLEEGHKLKDLSKIEQDAVKEFMAISTLVHGLKNNRIVLPNGLILPAAAKGISRTLPDAATAAAKKKLKEKVGKLEAQIAEAAKKLKDAKKVASGTGRAADAAKDEAEVIAREIFKLESKKTKLVRGAAAAGAYRTEAGFKKLVETQKKLAEDAIRLDKEAAVATARGWKKKGEELAQQAIAKRAAREGLMRTHNKAAILGLVEEGMAVVPRLPGAAERLAGLPLRQGWKTARGRAFTGAVEQGTSAAMAREQVEQLVKYRFLKIMAKRIGTGGGGRALARQKQFMRLYVEPHMKLGGKVEITHEMLMEAYKKGMNDWITRHEGLFRRILTDKEFGQTVAAQGATMGVRAGTAFLTRNFLGGGPAPRRIARSIMPFMTKSRKWGRLLSPRGTKIITHFLFASGRTYITYEKLKRIRGKFLEDLKKEGGGGNWGKSVAAAGEKLFGKSVGEMNPFEAAAATLYAFGDHVDDLTTADPDAFVPPAVKRMLRGDRVPIAVAILSTSPKNVPEEEQEEAASDEEHRKKALSELNKQQQKKKISCSAYKPCPEGYKCVKGWCKPTEKPKQKMSYVKPPPCTPFTPCPEGLKCVDPKTGKDALAGVCKGEKGKEETKGDETAAGKQKELGKCQKRCLDNKADKNYCNPNKYTSDMLKKCKAAQKGNDEAWKRYCNDVECTGAGDGRGGGGAVSGEGELYPYKGPRRSFAPKEWMAWGDRLAIYLEYLHSSVKENRISGNKAAIRKGDKAVKAYLRKQKRNAPNTKISANELWQVFQSDAELRKPVAGKRELPESKSLNEAIKKRPSGESDRLFEKLTKAFTK